MSGKIPSYALACIPDDTSILRFKLKPFSLGHYILLQRFNNPFVRENESFDTAKEKLSPEVINGLLMGLVICSMSYGEFHEWIAEKNWWDKSSLTRCLANQIRKSAFLARFRCLHPVYLHKWEWEMEQAINNITRDVCREKHFNALESINAFTIYIKQGSKLPNYWVERNDGRSGGSHWSHNVLVCLTSHLGYSHQEAFDVPLSKGLFDYMKYAEGNGVVTLHSDSEEEELIKYAEQNAKTARGIKCQD